MPFIVPTQSGVAASPTVTPGRPTRDFHFGRLGLPTVEDVIGETIGSPLTVTGETTAVGMRRPKQFTLNLPIHGTSGDVNPYASGDRMRRQLRSLMQNTFYRLAGTYMQFGFDPERNGWMVVGQANLSDAQVGGPTVAEYTLTINDIFRIAGLATHRAGWRTSLTDLRQPTSPIDYYGDYVNTGAVFGTLGTLCLVALPVGVADATVMEAPALTIQRPGAEGGVPLVVSKTAYIAGGPSGPLVDGDVVSWETSEAYLNRGDVVLADRRGIVTSYAPDLAFTNLVADPSFEHDTIGQAPFGWSGAAGQQITGAASTVTAQAAQVFSGTQSMRVVTPGGAGTQGARTQLVVQAAAGTPLVATVMVYVSTAQNMTVGFSDVNGSVTPASMTVACAATTWTPITVTWTPTGYSVGPTLSVYTAAGAGAQTFYVDAVIACVGSVLQFFNGDMLGGGWAGTPGQSASVMPPVVNLVPNGNFQHDLVGQAPAAWAFNASWVTTQAQTGLWPSGPARYRSLRLTTKPLNSGAVATATVQTGVTWYGVANAVQVFGTQTLAVRARPQILALAGSCTVGTLVTWYNTAGTQIGQAAGAPHSAGGWNAIADVFTVPAGAAAAVIALAVTSTATGSTMDLAVNHVQASYQAVNYFADGDMDGWRWYGTPGASVSGQNIADGQAAYGWEEFYGADWPYSWEAVGGASDTPVLYNGLCRVRYDASNLPGWCVDAWNGASYSEQGKLTVGVATTGSVIPDVLLQYATVKEWTPERAVIECGMLTSPSAATRERILITLQRGWAGPRIEVYTTGSAYPTVYWQTFPGDTNDSLMKVDAASAAYSSSAGPGFLDGAVLGAASFTGENEVALIREGRGRQTNFAVAQVAQAQSQVTAYGYATASGGVSFSAASAISSVTGYLRVSVGFATSSTDQVAEAEAIRYVSGTTSQVGDGTASGGLAVKDTQAAANSNTLFKAATNLLSARYRCFVRVKVDVATTGSFQAALQHGATTRWFGVGPTAVTTTSTTWTWIDLGDAAAPSVNPDFVLNAWHSAGTGGVYVDRVEFVLMEDRTRTGAQYTGARDHAQVALLDQRVETRMLTRA